LVRRVPIEFAELDKRGVIKHSTRIKIADDRAGRRAARVAEKLNEQLEIFWKGLSDGHRKEHLNSYDAARRRARSLGFDYVEGDVLLREGPEARLQRLEALVKHGVVNDPEARARSMRSIIGSWAGLLDCIVWLGEIAQANFMRSHPQKRLQSLGNGNR